jgi:Short C-terminal domain
MNYKRVIPSLVIGLGGVVLFSIGLIHVMKIGTCASGNTPYVIANPCPSGTGGYVLMIVGGILAATIGIMIGGFGGAGMIVWAALFVGSGSALLINALTAQGLSAGAKSAGYIIGAIFIPMGAVPLLWMLFSSAGSLHQSRIRARSKETDATVTRVEELNHFGYGQIKARVTYAVQPMDDASFEVSHDSNFLTTQVPRTGAKVKIRYDPTNHEQFEIVAQNAVALSAMTQGGRTPTAAVASLAAMTRATNGARDPLDRLKELTELRDAGALTPSEFETQKAKILAGT